MKKIFELLTMVALLIWGAVFLYIFFSGRVDYLLAERFRIGVPITGFGMIILGSLNLIYRNRDAGACAHDHAHGDHSHCDHEHHDHDEHEDHDHEHCDHDHHHDENCDHDHDHEPSHADHNHDEATASSLAFALLVLLVPLLTAARFTPKSFSGDYVKKWDRIEQDMQQLRQRKAAVSQKMAATENPYSEPKDKPDGTDSSSSGGGEAWGEFTLEDLKKMVPQTSAGDFLLDVPQIFYTAGDQELMKVMEGISVETTAQVIEDTAENSPNNRLRAYRLLIECCAADARPLSIPIDFTESAPEFKEMGWYKLIGRLHFDKSADHEYTPILQIKKFEATPEPADWMSIY